MTSFISGAVPAVALWVPFNIPVRDKVPGAKKLVDASAYYPKAAIVGGWAAPTITTARTATFCARHHPRLGGSERLLHRASPTRRWRALQKNHYQQVPLSDLKEQFQAQKMFTSSEWRKLYADGTVTKWLQQVTDFFVRFGSIQNPVPASQYFDPSSTWRRSSG